MADEGEGGAVEYLVAHRQQDCEGTLIEGVQHEHRTAHVRGVVRAGSAEYQGEVQAKSRRPRRARRRLPRFVANPRTMATMVHLIDIEKAECMIQADYVASWKVRAAPRTTDGLNAACADDRRGQQC